MNGQGPLMMRSHLTAKTDTGLERALQLLPLLSEALKDAQHEQSQAGLLKSQDVHGPSDGSHGTSGCAIADMDLGVRHPHKEAEKSSPLLQVEGDGKPATNKQSITLLPCWTQMVRRDSNMSMSTLRSVTGAGKGHHADLLGSMSFMHGNAACWDRLVSNPNSAFRVGWDVACCIVLALDFVFIPLELIGLSGGLTADEVAWVTPTFWTVDCAFSFVRGYVAEEGFVEKRLSKTVRKYARGWFLFDLTVLTIDWLSFISRAGVSFGSGDLALSLLRFLRLLRVARALKILSAIKMFQRLQTIVQGIHSEAIRLFLGIFKLVCGILFMNHLVACGWYAIGTFDQSWSDAWVAKREMQDRSFEYRYMTALHWSLTQFTPSSMEVHPENALERTYAICVVLVGMFMFSSLVSNVTSSMMDYRKQNSGRIEAHAILRRYLDENNVTLSLTSRIFRYVLLAESKVGHGRTHEKDVQVIKLLPRYLRSELHIEVCGPVLGNHPFFMVLNNAKPGALALVYDKTLEEVSLGFGQELFEAGEVAEMMSFVIMGAMRYHGISGAAVHRKSLGDDCARINITVEKESNENLLRQTYDKQKTAIESVADGIFSGAKKAQTTPWVSEATLWLVWQHAGTLTAEVNTEVIGIRAVTFQVLLAQEMPIGEASAYAHRFAEFYSNRPELLTDLPPEQSVLEGFVQDVFDEVSLEQAFGRKGATYSTITSHFRFGGSDSRTPGSMFGGGDSKATASSVAQQVIPENPDSGYAAEATRLYEAAEAAEPQEEVTRNVLSLRERPPDKTIRQASLRSSGGAA